MSTVRIQMRDGSIECAFSDLAQLSEALNRAMAGQDTMQHTGRSGLLKLTLPASPTAEHFSSQQQVLTDY